MDNKNLLTAGILIILSIFLINFISAAQVCQIYDNFSSGSLNVSKWQISQDVEGQPFTDLYQVNITLNNFQMQQTTTGDKRTYLVPKHTFTIGDVLEYDFNVVSKTGNYMQMDLLTGDQYIRLGIMGNLNGVQGYDELGVSHVRIEFQKNNLHLTRTEPSGIVLTNDLPLTNANGSYELYIGVVFTNSAEIDFSNFKLCTEVPTPTLEERIGLLESWKQIIEDWRTSTINTLTILTSKISDLTNKVNNNEQRITALENSSMPNYFKYLDASERKNMVCGYAEDNKLTNITDLGWSCNLAYKRNGNIQCNCKIKR